MHFYDLPLVFAGIGLVLYTVLAGADFGAGFWQLFPGRGERARRIREHAHHSMAPVWEANHVWLIFVLTVVWTAYPVAFASIASTLSVPLFIAAIGIILRGTAYATRSGSASTRERGGDRHRPRRVVDPRAVRARHDGRGDRVAAGAGRQRRRGAVGQLAEPDVAADRRARGRDVGLPRRRLPGGRRGPPRRAGARRRLPPPGAGGRARRGSSRRGRHRRRPRRRPPAVSSAAPHRRRRRPRRVGPRRPGDAGPGPAQPLRGGARHGGGRGGGDDRRLGDRPEPDAAAGPDDPRGGRVARGARLPGRGDPRRRGRSCSRRSGCCSVSSSPAASTTRDRLRRRRTCRGRCCPPRAPGCSRGWPRVAFWSASPGSRWPTPAGRTRSASSPSSPSPCRRSSPSSATRRGTMARDL